MVSTKLEWNNLFTPVAYRKRGLPIKYVSFVLTKCGRYMGVQGMAILSTESKMASFCATIGDVFASIEQMLITLTIIFLISLYRRRKRNS